MFVLRLSVVLVVVTTFGTNAEAQLFRFRANPTYNGRSNAMQQQGYPSAYDARAYQYTQVQPQTNYVPSQRTVTQRQTPACGCQQSNLVPANSAAASQQRQQLTQQQPNQQQRAQQQVVVVTHRDPYSGRLFQRQYLVQRPRPSQGIAQQQATAQSSALQLSGKANQAALTETPRQVLSQATSIGVTSPNLSPLPNGGVKTTSFESPILESTESSSAEFSVFGTDEKTATGSKSVLESSFPILEAPADSSKNPGNLLDSDGDIDLDLPALELEDSQ